MFIVLSSYWQSVDKISTDLVCLLKDTLLSPVQDWHIVSFSVVSVSLLIRCRYQCQLTESGLLLAQTDISCQLKYKLKSVVVSWYLLIFSRQFCSNGEALVRFSEIFHSICVSLSKVNSVFTPASLYFRNYLPVDQKSFSIQQHFL